MPLPFDQAELRQRVRPAPPMMTAPRQLPPGLRELADAEGLTDEQVRQLAEAWGTIRGKKPTTLAEWRPLYQAIKKFIQGDDGNNQGTPQ